MNPTKKYIKPGSPGLKVRNPADMKVFLPEKGALVHWTGPYGRYWRRRVNCGDCVITVPPKQKKVKHEKCACK